MRSTIHPSKNGTPTTLNKTNKTPILISFQLNVQFFIKTYNVEKKKSRSTASKQEWNPNNAITEIQAKYSKKQQIQDTKSEIYSNQAGTEP